MKINILERNNCKEFTEKQYEIEFSGGSINNKSKLWRKL